jgi:hypothetical protein
MALNYPKLAATADRLISQNGKQVTFKQQTQTPADNAKPWRGGGAGNEALTIVAFAVVIPNDEIDDKEAMRRGDATAYIAASTFGNGNPFAAADLVLIDTMIDDEGYTWHVHGVKIINPGSLRVLYTAELEH